VDVEIADEIVEGGAHLRRVLDEEAEVTEGRDRGPLTEQQPDMIALRGCGALLQQMPER
jgi:hypothetical protein